MRASHGLAHVQDSQSSARNAAIPPLKQNHSHFAGRPLHEGWPRLLTILCLLLPFGSMASSYYGTRSLLLIVFLVEGLAVFVAAARLPMHGSDTTFLVLIGSISLSLLLSTPMSSNNLVGYDIHQEFYLFQQVLATGNWNPQNTLLYNPSISISILPSMIKEVSALDGVAIFKFIYPALFAITPVILYKFYRKVLAPKWAFLSVFLFMSYPAFYSEIVTLGRQEVAEVLLILSVLILFSSRTVGTRAGTVTLALLTLGIVTSHYSLAYIYMLLLVLPLLLSAISRRVVGLTTFTTASFLLAIAFLWYLNMTNGNALLSFTNSLSLMIRGLIEDFFNPASRPLIILQAFGLQSATPGLLHEAYRATQYLVLFALVFGFIVFLRKSGKTLVEKKMLPLMTVAFVLLGSAVILPYFAGTLNLSRFYHIALLFISPCFAYSINQLGAILRTVYTSLSHRSVRIRPPFSAKGILAAAILLSYFLFSGGWVWAVAMDRPTSLLFDAQRMLSSSDSGLWIAYFEKYTTSQDVYAVGWMKYLPSSTTLCGDYISRYHLLFSYAGRLPDPALNLLRCNLRQSYVYLNALNTLHDIGMDSEGGGAPPYSISGIVATENRIYSNGAATIGGSSGVFP